MAISKEYMLGPVVTAAGQINQIQDYSPDSGIETFRHWSDGQADPNFAGIMLQSPKFGFSTTALKRALDIAGISGYAVAAAASMYFQKITNGTVRTGGSTALKLAGTKGMLCPLTLSCEDKGLAKLQMSIALISTDGTTAPMTGTDSQALPSITATDQLFTLGPIMINGTEVEGIKSVTVDFGLEMIIDNGSGEAYPTFVGIKTRKPSITFRTTDPTYLASAAYYAAQTVTDSLVYFRKMAANAIRTANATAEHISISIDDGIIHVKPAGGGTEDTQGAEVTIEPIFDGTNDILALNTATAIS